MQPVYLMNNQTGFVNKVNSMMDHVWDGFYTGQKHKSMFPMLIDADGFYYLEYTGTPPQKMRYALHGTDGQVKIRVYYWNAGSYAVSVKGKTVDPTEWDADLGTASELTGYKGCGENRYVGVENYLEFILTAGCEIHVTPVDAILCNVRLEWTLDEFYSSGGTTSFTDRVSAALGIHASQIKIVAVYEGSVVVDYIIQAESEALSDITQLRRDSQKLSKLISANSTDLFGAPILGSTMDGSNDDSRIKTELVGVPFVMIEPEPEPAVTPLIKNDTEPAKTNETDSNNGTTDGTTLTPTDKPFERQPDSVEEEPSKIIYVFIVGTTTAVIGLVFGCVMIVLWRSKKKSLPESEASNPSDNNNLQVPHTEENLKV